MTDVLHVPFVFFPDACGGTEVYVRGLALGLTGLGFCSSIAAPGPVTEDYELDGLKVYRFAGSPSGGLAQAYGQPDEVASRCFEALVRKLRPRIVHLHAHTSSVSERLLDVAHAAGARTVVTYHTPTVSCPRGTMMRYGRIPCDGALIRARCVTCLYQKAGAPVPLAATLSTIPDWLNFEGAPLSLRLPGLVHDGQARFARFAGKADRIVAVCDWVRAVLLRNGVPPAKVCLSRQGLDRAVFPRSRPCTIGRKSRLAFFGRLDPVKGLDLLIEVLAAIPSESLTLDIYGVIQGEEQGRFATALASADRRIHLRPPLRPQEVAHAMGEYDAIVVPSQWLETGPLVVLEAFGSGVPVIGSRLGGIAELVTDNEDGLLVDPPDSLQAWTDTLKRWTSDPALRARLRAGVRPPRTMAAAAGDMASLYRELSA